MVSLMVERKQIKVLNITLSIIFSCFAFIGFIFLSRIDHEDIIRLPLFLYAIPYVLLAFFYYDRLSHFTKDKRKLIFSIILSFLFAISLIAGYQLRVSISLASGIRGKIGILVKSAFLAFTFIPIFEYLFSSSSIKNQKKCTSTSKKEWDRIALFFISWVIIFISWIPILLAYWPGIMSYDSHRQFNEAYNNFYWELQPIAHTFLIHIAIILGQKLGSPETGVSIYSITQMAVLSISLAYLTSFIYKLSKNRNAAIISLIFYTLLPITSVLSISVTKDIFFTAFFLILTTALIERFTTKLQHPLFFDVIIVLSGTIMMQFRKNGIYGFALFTIIALNAMLISKVKKNEKNAKRNAIALLIVCSITIITGLVSMNVIRLSLNAGKGPEKEKYSVIIQQFARIAYYHSDTLSEEDSIIIEKYLPGYTTNPEYHFSLVDAPKYNSDNEAFKNTSELMKDWLHIIASYPEDSIDAYLGLINGYFFTDDIAISQYLGYGRDNMRGLLETFNAVNSDIESSINVESKSRLPWLQYYLEGIVSNEEYLNYPVIPILFRPAFYIWIAITCAAILIYKKRYHLLMVSSLQLTYFLTVLLGPVTNIRYAFQIILAVPLFITMAFSTTDNYH